MSKPEFKVLEGGEQAAATAQESPAQADEFTEELPPLGIDPTSFDARMAGVEPCSVARELSKHNSVMAAFEVEQAELRGEVKTLEDERRVMEESWRRQWERKPEDLDDYILFIKRKAASFIDWGDIGQLWNASPRDAIELWKAIRLEARDEFLSGHYGARPFEVMSWQHEAWRRAQYLAVRDGLVEEWKPRGASEFILIDQMTQSYVMQMHWTEVAMKRAQGTPRLESGDFYEWKRRRRVESKVYQWDKGDWDIPYQHEAEAVEQAMRLVDLCMKSFHRAARQLANIRLVRAKTARTRRRDKAKTIKAVRVA
jgi:hypothetical protein